MDRAHIEWSRRHFDMLADGGWWGVPRSGLVFFRRGDMLVLEVCMPWQEGMSITEDELRKQQQSEYDGIKEHFEAAGVKVVRRDAS
jgi:hypothetical protein